MAEVKVNIIKKVESWIDSCIGNPVILKHHYRTRDHLLEILPDASIESQIAALTHDIERSLEDPILVPSDDSDDFYGGYLIRHGENSAKAVLDFVDSHNFKLDFERLKYLLINHEIGGDEECDTLRDADSVSFLEVMPEFFLEKYSKKFSKDKFEYMFNRVEGDKAKELARPFYEKVMEEFDGKE